MTARAPLSQPKPTVAVAGHFGEWLQGRLGPQGPVALVTVACPALRVRAGGTPPPLPPETLARFCRALDLPSDRLPGLAMDMPPGGGAGASTAALVAIARLMGFAGTTEALVAACIGAEGASDPLMLPRPDAVLWASRTGRIVRDLAPPPRCVVVGGFWGPPLRTDPADDAFPDIADLAGDWARTTEARDLSRAAALASESATRCTALRGPGDPMAELARELGALGHLRAHTGSARGLIFAPDEKHGRAKGALVRAGLTGVIAFATGGT
ncbi:propanediol utilization protein [Thetidibacter halocola]|uniref:Propanediol utilization protein n=1 Tax=Thetidibacter halocola TaxID=2827239 RepID=A0A8J7WF31_9RHOB|nr:propanediol utilization protein [Thetidibacter halocola]MBS0123999.1 propanediol utilization protein [Thetidibacter halocola]